MAGDYYAKIVPRFFFFCGILPPPSPPPPDLKVSSETCNVKVTWHVFWKCDRVCGLQKHYMDAPTSVFTSGQRKPDSYFLSFHNGSKSSAQTETRLNPRWWKRENRLLLPSLPFLISLSAAGEAVNTPETSSTPLHRMCRWNQISADDADGKDQRGSVFVCRREKMALPSVFSFGT